MWKTILAVVASTLILAGCASELSVPKTVAFTVVNPTGRMLPGRYAVVFPKDPHIEARHENGQTCTSVTYNPEMKEAVDRSLEIMISQYVQEYAVFSAPPTDHEIAAYGLTGVVYFIGHLGAEEHMDPRLQAIRGQTYVDIVVDLQVFSAYGETPMTGISYRGVSGVKSGSSCASSEAALWSAYTDSLSNVMFALSALMRSTPLFQQYSVPRGEVGRNKVMI